MSDRLNRANSTSLGPIKFYFIDPLYGIPFHPRKSQFTVQNDFLSFVFSEDDYYKQITKNKTDRNAYFASKDPDRKPT